MTPPTLTSLLALWEENYAQGRDLPVEELCPGHPELAAELQRAIEALKRVRQILDENPPGPDPLETVLPPSPPPREGDCPTLDAPAGYQVLGLLGRGGMGLVYKARHVALGRVVAVKMVLAGGHAGEDEKRRFLREAESVAKVRHPGVVQVYDFGTHQGLPYFTMELCEGGSLADRLGGAPLPAREAARLVEQLARAVQAAHEAGVVHRDLKPANVLLAADGQVKVTDFGLAKQVEGSGLTATGAVMGTPSYMAPEQAQGRKDIGPAADVYALGAVLYECLTGRPPFKAASLHETLLQVINDEPVPVRRLQPGVPKDLETVCDKCLQKEPHRRYASAKELQDDLGRFLRGEPVLARPVGKLERAAKWARRNPALAALAVLLVAATGVSSYLAFDSAHQARLAREEKQNAEAGRDDLEGALARTWLSPLAVAPGQLTDAELEAMKQLAGYRGQPLAARFLTEAVRDPGGRARLATRGTLALHAALGLDARKRQEVEELLLRLLATPGVPEGYRREIALACAGLGGLSGPAAETLGWSIVGAFLTEPDHDVRLRLLGALPAVAPRMGPKAASRTFASLARSHASEESLFVRQGLARGLAALSERLSPEAAAAPLADALAKESDLTARLVLGEALAALSSRLGPKETARARADAFAPLAEAFPEWENPSTRVALSRALAGAGARNQFMKGLWVGFARKPEEDRPARLVLAEALVALSARMGPEEAAALLADSLAKERDSSAWLELARALAALSARLGPREAALACAGPFALLAAALDRTADPRDRGDLAQGLAALSERVGPREAAPACARACALLADDLAKAADPRDRGALAQALAALFARMGTEEAAPARARACALLADDLTKESEPTARLVLAEALAALSMRAGPEEAARARARACALLADDLAKAADPRDRGALAQALAALSERMGPEESPARARAFAPLADALAKVENPSARGDVALTLSVLLTDVNKQAPGASSALAGLSACGSWPTGLALLQLAGTRPSCPLLTQDLVELLKEPLCVAEARRVILDQLEARYNRKFIDHWDFVRYAEEQKLGLDFSSPPKRPRDRP
jgi:serine/threonine-protein kinase